MCSVKSVRSMTQQFYIYIVFGVIYISPREMKIYVNTKTHTRESS